MKPLDKYVIYNPYEHTRALTPNMINDFNNAIERQKELLLKPLNVHIEELLLDIDYYVINFCHSEFKNSDFAMNWEVKVKRNVFLKWVENNLYIDEYFEDSELAKAWLEEQDLNTLEYVI